MYDDLRELFGLDGDATASLYEILERAEILADQASQGLTQLGVLASVTDLLTRATIIHRMALRTIYHFTYEIPEELDSDLAVLSTRFRDAARKVRDSAPNDETLYATHHAVAVILDRIGTDIHHTREIKVFL